MDYPIEVTRGRKNTEGCVIGVIVNDLLSIKEYKLTSNMFISEEGTFYFSLLKNLSDKGVVEITDTDIRLHSSSEVIEQYKSYNGFKTLQKLKNTIDTKNTESYIDDLNKKNLLMKLCDDGYDLTKSIKIETKNKTLDMSYIELFKNMNTGDILNFLHSRLSSLDELVNQGGVEEMNSEITDDFIDRLRQGIEQGTSFSIMGEDVDGKTLYAFPYLSNQIQGFQRKTLNQISGHTNTGKSTVLASMAMAMAYQGEKVLFISNEMGCDVFRLNFLSLIINRVFKNTKLNRKKLKSGTLTEEDLVVINQAKKIFNEKYAKSIDIVSLSENDMNQVERYLRKYALGKGTTCLIYDVFKMSFKNGDANYLTLIEDSLILEGLVKTYDVIGISSMQLALNSKNSLRLNCQHLSNAKGVSEILSTLITIRGVYEQELDPSSKYYLRPFKFIKNEKGIWDEEEVKDIDKGGIYRVFEIAKSRSSETSEDTGICALYKFYGGSGSFVEYSLCRPQNMVIGGNLFGK